MSECEPAPKTHQPHAERIDEGLVSLDHATENPNYLLHIKAQQDQSSDVDISNLAIAKKNIKLQPSTVLIDPSTIIWRNLMLEQ
ncbi:hypothetical protein [Pseudomonas sp. LB3P14]